MRVLVTYSSRYGATRGIAERIAVVLREAGLAAQARSLHVLGNVDSYGAFVVGSAVYMGRWQRDANAFVRTYQDVLAERPVWLYSSGPLGTAETDAKGRDVRIASEPTEIEQLRSDIRPRGHRVFFGAFSRASLGFTDRLVAAMPASKDLLPEGDFRNWTEIDAWAREIAAELTAVPVG
jgi:menaquinone-dependent protoporphyrinogen oxidase